MTAETTALIVALAGVLGTLSATLFTQRSAFRVRQLESEDRRQDRIDDRMAADRQAAKMEKQAVYAELSCVAWEFRSTVRRCVVDRYCGHEVDSVQLDAARTSFREAMGRSDMVLPTRCLIVADEVSHGLHLAYQVARGEMDPLVLTPESFARFYGWMDGPLMETLRLLRQVLREDLGVLAASGDIEGSCRRLAAEREASYDRHAYLMRLNQASMNRGSLSS
ncbi:hypothetical protein [Nocardia sp. NPDC052566]|uniref:hypothetical protein n=1 Tax=Nocardia sp. NPDC052566 TaxID=3364330 RepID=UPI0037C87D3E